MIRPLAALATFALLSGAALAQEAAPSTAPEIVVDPAASIDTTPKQANMLTGFYATQAVIELCAVAIEPTIAEGMAADRARLETALSMDATAAPSTAPEIVVDPAASIDTTPKQANMLTGFYATQAVIELCTVAIEPTIAEGMAADRARLETALSMDATAAAAAYAQVKADVEKTQPDCTEGSPDRAGVDAVTAIYAALPPPDAPPATAPAAPEAGTATTPPPVAPAQ